MEFIPLDLPGAFLVNLECHRDDRGHFARTFCKHEFQEQGLVDEFVQCNISVNDRKDTLRGMHYQSAPYAETKLVYCLRGMIYDVLVDLRPESQHYLRWQAVEMKADDNQFLYIPAGFAHGFLTREDDTHVFYQMSAYYRPDAAAGFKWCDPLVGIHWPSSKPILSERDANFPALSSMQV